MAAQPKVNHSQSAGNEGTITSKRKKCQKDPQDAKSNSQSHNEFKTLEVEGEPDDIEENSALPMQMDGAAEEGKSDEKDKDGWIVKEKKKNQKGERNFLGSPKRRRR